MQGIATEYEPGMSKEDGKILAFGLFGAWLTCEFMLTTVSVITTLLTICILLKRKSGGLKYAILLNPFIFLFVVNTGEGVMDYFQGKAEIKAFGYPSAQFANIDKQHRLGIKSEGCSISGTPLLGAKIYNRTVKKLVSKFGFQKGSYEGLLPSEEEARRILRDSSISQIGFCELQADGFIALSDHSNIYTISLEEQHGLIRNSILNSKVAVYPKVARLEDDCVVSQLNEYWIYVMDIRENRFVAQYRAEESR